MARNAFGGADDGARRLQGARDRAANGLPTDLESVIARLEHALGPLELTAGRRGDPLHLAGLICDAGERLATDEFVACLAIVAFETAYEMAEDRLRRDCLLLEPKVVAEEALIAIWEDNRSGRRRTPFDVWLKAVVQDTARSRLDDPRVALPPIGPRAARPQRIANASSRIVNSLPFELRRIGWLFFREGHGMERIARETEVPLERVELVLHEVGSRALKSAGADGVSRRRRDDGRGGIRHEGGSDE